MEWVALITGIYYELAGLMVREKWDPGSVNMVFGPGLSAGRILSYYLLVF